MGFLGIELAKASPNYRKKRFAAFVIDLIIVLLLWYIMYRIIGKPDFPSVKQAMDNAMALPKASQQEAMNLAFTRFDAAFRLGLIIWFAYEVITTVLLGGRTLGKMLVRLQIVPMNPKRGNILQCVLLVLRSALKMLSLYLLQGIPFLICALNVLANRNRSGFDIFVKTQVIESKLDVVLSGKEQIG